MLELFEGSSKQELKGAVIFYIDVGSLPPVNAEAFIDRIKERTSAFINDLNINGYRTVFLPVRNSQTRVEYLPLK